MDRSWEYTVLLYSINRSQTHDGTEAAQFPEKEHINGIFVAVHCRTLLVVPVLQRGSQQWRDSFKQQGLSSLFSKTVDSRNKVFRSTSFKADYSRKSE